MMSNGEDFLIDAHRVFSETTWTVSDLVTSLDAPGGLSTDTLPAELAERLERSMTGARVISKSLGRWISNRDGRWAGTLCVRSAGVRAADNVRLWRIESYTPPA
jgi:hypothetical protein